MGDAPVFQNKKEEKRDMPRHGTCFGMVHAPASVPQKIK